MIIVVFCSSSICTILLWSLRFILRRHPAFVEEEDDSGEWAQADDNDWGEEDVYEDYDYFADNDLNY